MGTNINVTTDDPSATLIVNGQNTPIPAGGGSGSKAVTSSGLMAFPSPNSVQIIDGPKGYANLKIEKDGRYQWGFGNSVSGSPVTVRIARGSAYPNDFVAADGCYMSGKALSQSGGTADLIADDYTVQWETLDGSDARGNAWINNG